jgi:glutamyl-tRNA reductase
LCLGPRGNLVTIALFGLNHNTAPVEVRECLHVPETALPELTEHLKKEGLREVVILSTCNRTEVYFSCEECDTALKRVSDRLAGFFRIDERWLTEYTYAFREQDAFRHLFLVASGLDSMVVGEPQILGQVKEAYRAATLLNATGFLLDKAFHRTFKVAKRIRTETRIGYNPVSISSMAVELAKKIFGELAQKRILVIGAGEMCEIALRHFKKEGLSDIFVTNRTFQNAQRLAEEITGTPLPFVDIPVLLTRVDMILSSTGAEKPIIDREVVLTAMKKRKSRPLFFIDIAVPRDVDPKVNDIENVYLYDIDDLRDLSQKHLSDRLKESERAHEIVEEEVAKFTEWLGQLDMGPLIAHIVQSAEEMRRAEFRKTARRLKNADAETLKGMEILTKTIVNKLLHPHMALIKQNGSPAAIDVIKKLFTYEDEDEKEMDSRDQG